MKNFSVVSILFAFAMVTFLVSCHDHEESPTLKQAVEVHKNIRQLCGDLEEGLDQQMNEIEKKMSDTSAQADSLTAVQLAKMNSELENLHGDLQTWKDNLVEVPGHCFHEEGEPHEHHDQAHLKGLSDEEILEIQQELETQLKAISDQLNDLKSK
ncbi:MAG: hypothetical protein ACPGED_02300 [Flavobacteriales bacterium]